FSDLPTATPPKDTPAVHAALPISRPATGAGRRPAKPPAGPPQARTAARRRPARCGVPSPPPAPPGRATRWPASPAALGQPATQRSEEHTSELQSRGHLVCRLLLEK